MITVIDGLTGSGKTWFMARLALKDRKRGEIIYPNLDFIFPNDNEGVERWHALSETYHLTNGTICIDEAQKLFDAHAWMYLPISFSEKIASHRHEFLNIITTTQDFGHIDVRVRENVHQRYHCQSVFRFPLNERMKPWLQMIKITRKKRSFDDTTGIKWEKGRTRIHFISIFFTKQLYDTYANINLPRFLCQIKRDKGKWLITLQSRELINSKPFRQ